MLDKTLDKSLQSMAAASPWSASNMRFPCRFRCANA